MGTEVSSELADVLDRVKDWPEADHFALVQRVLETLVPKFAAPPPVPRGRSVEEIFGTFKTDKPAPDDESVRQWIDEHRMEKYG